MGLKATVKVIPKTRDSANKIKKDNFSDYQKRVLKAIKYLETQIIKSMSFRIYSLNDLALKDHPYARKRFPMRIRTGAIPPMKRYQVSARSGSLVRGLTIDIDKKYNKNKKSTIEGSVNHNGKPYYAKWVFEGTKVLIGRNPLSGTYNDPKIKAKIRQILTGK